MKYVMEILPSLFSGAGMTLQIFFETLILSLPLGILVSFGLSSRFAPLKWLLNFYVWLMRGTPLLLQLIFVFYGLPIVGLTFPRYMAALVAFVLNYTAYFAEIFRGGNQAIDRGQFEAAKVLQVPYDLVQYVHDNGRLPVVNFAAGGVATPADAALMMQLGAEGVFVGSGIFKSGNPAKRAASIVKAVTNYTDAKLIAELSADLGEAMVGINEQEIALLMAERGK